LDRHKKSLNNDLLLFSVRLSFWAGLPDFSWNNIPECEKIYQLTIKLLNGHKLYKMAVNILQMDITYTNIFDFKALQNLPKLGFLVWKYTIWQPCFWDDPFRINVKYENRELISWWRVGLSIKNILTAPHAQELERVA
jgi:hypothetical protein